MLVEKIFSSKLVVYIFFKKNFRYYRYHFYEITIFVTKYFVEYAEMPLSE